MKRERHVIIGASLAGIRAAEAMRQRGFEGEIVLVGAEPDPPYHRPPLSKEFLRDADTDFEPLAIQPQQFYAEQRIDLRLGTRATRLDAATRTIALDTGERLGADRVVIATGAEPRPLEVPGIDLAGVHYLRTHHHALALRQRLERSERVVVVGARLIGLEVASAGRAAGKQVTVLEAAPAPLRRILGDELGRVIAQLHEEQGVMIRCSTAIARIRGRRTVEAVELSDHSIVPADLVVVGIGVRPAIAWLAGSGLRLDDGIVVDALGHALRRLVTGRSRVRPAELADPHVPLGELGIRPATAA